MSNNKELTQLQKQIKKNFNKALEETSIQLNTMIEYMYENAIQLFYESMTPKYYSRTYSTYLGSDMYDDINNKYNISFVDGVYDAGITVSPKNIPGQPYYKGGQNRPDKDWVFERTYIEGIHGITPTERRAWGKNDYWDRKIRKTYRTSFTNWLKMKQIGWKFNQYKNIRFPKLGGISHMPLESYTYVGSRNYVMRPSPSDIMWKEFREFRKPKNIEKLFNYNLIYTLSK